MNGLVDIGFLAHLAVTTCHPTPIIPLLADDSLDGIVVGVLPDEPEVYVTEWFA